MAEYIKLVDLSLCTGCRGCQVSCKEWNGLPAGKTKCTGSLQNPPDLNYNTWCLVRFDEIVKNDKLNWIMRHDACMHCETPACTKACPSPGALTKQENGAVTHNPKYCIGCRACATACPFEIPKYSKVEDKVSKCTLCFDRISENKKPACVTSCNTGCLSFGIKEDMLKKATKRAEAIGGKVYPVNPKYETHMLYIMPANIEPKDLKMNSNPKMPATVLWWKNLFKPFTLLGIGGVAGAALLHYLIKGPHEVHEKKEGGE